MKEEFKNNSVSSVLKGHNASVSLGTSANGR